MIVETSFVISPYSSAQGVHPPLDVSDYGSTAARAPHQPLVVLPHRLTEVTGPLFGSERIRPGDDDLTVSLGGEAAGQRIVVTGRVLDFAGRPVAGSLIEIWQANAAGRYRHSADDSSMPLDPHFTGAGRIVTDAGGWYRFTTIRPGIYPWQNHPNAWRPAHIHFSLFGRAFVQRLVSQMYFPDDPVHFQDPIFNSVRDEQARSRLICQYDHDLSADNRALGYRWDIVLRGRKATPFEGSDHG